MNPDVHAHARDVFLQVIAAPEAQRNALLASLCANDMPLLAEVQRLLAHHREGTIEQQPPTVALPDASAGRGSVVRSGRQVEGFPTGTIIASRYRIVARLGGGGMGVVYRAEDLTLGQTVALKFLPADFAQNATWLEQFRGEVRVARTVTHPNVCRIYDIVETDGEHFISMEYIDGEDLASLLRRIGRIPRDKALEISHQLCSGLAAAHAAGVLHRDLKPANVMLDGTGRVRITDFGLAGSIVDLRDDRRIAGTPAYMAPEQITGRRVDERSDIYALGLVLYELFTGKAALIGNSFADFVRMHQSVEPVPPSEIVADIDPEIENIIRSCLAKNPDDRPRSAQAVSSHLPGGNVLSRVIAAGETPAPELIAAAAVPHALSRSQLTIAAVLSLVLLAGFLALGGRGRFDFNVQEMKPPTVLLERARAFAQVDQLLPGWREAWGYAPADEAARAILHLDQFDARFELAHSPRNELVFWYRTLPEKHGPRFNELPGTSRIQPRDPPEDRPGMRSVILDSAGRLVAFSQFPVPGAKAGDHDRSVDWAAHLTAAGLDDTQVIPCQPILEIPAFADDRAAWCAADPQRVGATVRIESAARAGAPLNFVVLLEDAGATQADFRNAQRKAAAQGLGKIIMILTLLAAVPLAHRNLLRGRGDARTALQLATVLFALRMTEWLLNTHHQAQLAGELALLQDGLLASAFLALAVGLFYLALEPLARRYWPYALVSWTRLSSGRGWDAIVGQHVLIGTLLGIIWATLLAVDRLVVQAAGLGLRPMIWEERFTLPLLGARYAVSLTAHLLSNALLYGLLIMLVLALLRAGLRRPLLAALVATAVIALLFLPYGNSSKTAWLAVGLGCVGSAIWAIVRYGLLTVIVAAFVLGTLVMFPMTLRAQVWFADLTLYALAIVLLLLAGGFLIARRAPTVV